MTRLDRPALVIGNRNHTGPGLVGSALRSHGFTLETVEREVMSSVHDLAHYAIVVSLGSLWSAYWTDVATATTWEVGLLTDAMELGVPVLGLCYGSQLLAMALGGSVTRAGRLEFGWSTIETVEPDVIPPGPWFQFHGDVWSLPPGARLLAENDVAPQAFVYRTCLGVQFHPEATPSDIQRWCRADPTGLEGTGRTLGEVVAEAAANSGGAEHRANQIVDALLYGELSVRRPNGRATDVT